MEVKPYRKEIHAEMVREWLRLHDFNPEAFDETIELGFIAEKESHPIAAVFIRRMEGGYGLVDGIVSNPRALAEDRNEALDLVTKSFKEKARDLKIKRLFAFISDIGTIERSLRHGFFKQPDTLLFLDL